MSDLRILTCLREIFRKMPKVFLLYIFIIQNLTGVRRIANARVHRFPIIRIPLLAVPENSRVYLFRNGICRNPVATIAVTP